MTGPAYGNRSRSIHRAVVDLAAAYLDQQGIAAVSKHEPVKASDALGNLDPDLALANVDVKVTSRLRPFRLAEDLEAAQRTAAVRGTTLGALIQWRSDQPIDQAYVVMPLSGFVRLVRGDHLTS